MVGNTVADFFVETERFPLGSGSEFGPLSLAVAQGAARLDVGGNAGRTAALLAELGARARLYTRLGSDLWGDWLRSELRRREVDVVGAGGGETSTNFVATDAAGKRASFFFPGRADYGVPEVGAGTSFVVVAACPFPDLTQLASWLPRLGAGVPALVDPGPGILGRPGLAELARLAAPQTYLSVNSSELAELTGEGDVAGGLRQARAIGFRNVVVKLGSRGALVSSGTGASLLPGEPLAERARSTVGAGDAFNAGLVFGLANGFDLCTSAALGNRVARRRLSAGRFGPNGAAELLSHLDDDVNKAQEV